MSGEAASRATITLPGSQKRMLEKVKEAGKPVVAVLMNGRPLALKWEHQNIDAILETWHLGVQMGTAVANVIFGAVNPSGKLSVSFPRVTGQCPIYYNHPNTGRPGGKSKFTSKYMDIENGALYPFGFGLSYTEYTYSNLILERHNDSIRVFADVQNTGQKPGTEIVQLYVRDIVGSIVRPVLEMKDYQKVTLLPGEVRTVSFDLPKQKLGFYDNKGDFKFEDGEFLICLGKNSQEYLEEKITLTFD
jgi:beta-glucosidase